VEDVLAHVATRSVWKAALLAILLFVVPLWHLVWDPQLSRAEGYALAALLTGFGAMALVGPFPFPLIGHGAAPILGFGLALGAATRRDQFGIAEHLETLDRAR
jgi:peptidoglycan/LPS O-acetylase OafA/YrhL